MFPSLSNGHKSHVSSKKACKTLTKEAVTTLEDYSYKKPEIHFETSPILDIL